MKNELFSLKILREFDEEGKYWVRVFNGDEVVAEYTIIDIEMCI